MILTLNGGSSSLKFALFTPHEEPVELGSGQIERAGTPAMKLIAKAGPWGHAIDRDLGQARTPNGITGLVDFLADQGLVGSIAIVGHRVVHGGPRFFQPTRVNREMLSELQRLSPFDPNHLPAQIALMENMATLLPGIPQFACFDTAFHQAMPEVARRFPLPRTYHDAGVRRYGFHGLSYTSLQNQIEKLDPDLARGRVIMAHLGSGCSMAAIRDGQPVDTTMGFTPTAGLMMGTRTGDLDPGLALYFARTESMSPDQFNDLINHHSGLLGVSGISGDVRDLLSLEKQRTEAAQALELFCQIARKTIGALSASLGGLNGLVFSGGIGEKSPEIRERICRGLEYLGVHLDPAANAQPLPSISPPGSSVRVLVIPTNEEKVIAKAALRFLSPPGAKVEKE